LLTGGTVVFVFPCTLGSSGSLDWYNFLICNATNEQTQMSKTHLGVRSDGRDGFN